MQMRVTKTKTACFVFWTTHRMVVDNITFDKELWESMKSHSEVFYKDFFKLFFFFQSKGLVWNVLNCCLQQQKGFLQEQKIFQKKSICKHVNKKVSFVLTSLLKKTHSLPLLLLLYKPVRESKQSLVHLETFGKNCSETSQGSPEIF